jgi:hypothetical protein
MGRSAKLRTKQMVVVVGVVVGGAPGLNPDQAGIRRHQPFQRPYLGYELLLRRLVRFRLATHTHAASCASIGAASSCINVAVLAIPGSCQAPWPRFPRWSGATRFEPTLGGVREVGNACKDGSSAALRGKQVVHSEVAHPHAQSGHVPATESPPVCLKAHPAVP